MYSLSMRTIYRCSSSKLLNSKCNLIASSAVNRKSYGNNSIVRCLSNDSFREALNKIRQGKEAENNTKTEANNTNSTTSNDNNDNKSNGDSTDQSSSASHKEQQQTINNEEIYSKVSHTSASIYMTIVDQVKGAWKEMIGDTGDSLLKKKVVQASSYVRARKVDDEGNPIDPSPSSSSDDEAEAKVGGGAMVLVKEPTSAWEAMKNRLQDSPIIKELRKKTKVVYQSAASTDIGQQAVKAGQSIKDKLEDAREFWETSQNPLVYTVSGVWENITGETEEGTCIKEIKKLDADFVLEDWSLEVRKKLIPSIIKAHLVGDTKVLKPWLSESTYNKLAADIKARKQDGIVFDPNIIDIEQNNLICRMVEVGPVIMIVYMVQQINCIRNRKNEIIEGSEGETRAKFYTVCFQQRYNDEQEIVEWKIVDYMLNGDLPYY